MEEAGIKLKIVDLIPIKTNGMQVKNKDFFDYAIAIQSNLSLENEI